MGKLIDADVFTKNLIEACKDLRSMSTKTVGIAIDATPAADAVPRENVDVAIQFATEYIKQSEGSERAAGAKAVLDMFRGATGETG